MNILYVTQNYESVQKHLHESLKDVLDGVYLAHYNIVGGKKAFSTDEVMFFHSRIRVKGFFFFKLKLWRIQKKCNDYYKDIPLDVLHGNMLFCDGYICRKVAKKKNIPYCVSVRSTDINSKFIWKIPWLRRMGLKNLSGASAIIFLSSNYRDKLLKKVPPEYRKIIIERSCVIPNGIDYYYIKNAFYKEGVMPNKDQVRLIFVGKISKRKNLETTIQACEILKTRGIGVSLKVLGAIVDREYEDLMARFPFVTYLGKCDKEQIVGHLRDSDIFVMPSHIETFGLVYLEAMTQGLPVIYTRDQGFDGQFPEGSIGYAVNDRSPEEIADSVERIIADYPTLSKNATNSARECSWGQSAQRLAELYRMMVKE